MLSSQPRALNSRSGVADISIGGPSYNQPSFYWSLKTRSGTQTVIWGIKSGAQTGAVPGVSTHLVVDPLLVLACFVLHTLKRLFWRNLRNYKPLIYFTDLSIVSRTTACAARPAMEKWKHSNNIDERLTVRRARLETLEQQGWERWAKLLKLETWGQQFVFWFRFVFCHFKKELLSNQ